MLIPQVLALTVVLAPSLASAAIFPKDTRVKMLDAKGFSKAMKRDETSVVAFVAPWCGHCQRMVPEYSKAAQSLYPLVPLYAVDCDADTNKRFCQDQGVQGFPTVKLFPRGNQKPSVTFDSPTRTASAFINWVSRLVPNNVKKFSKPEDISDWVTQKVSKPRALLFSKDKKVPLLWQVLNNKYGKDIAFGSLYDEKRKGSSFTDFGTGEKKSSIVIYPIGSISPVVYGGLTKYDPLSKFLKSVIDGTADLKAADEAPKSESGEPHDQKQASKDTTDNSRNKATKEEKSAPVVATPVDAAEQIVFQAPTSAKSGEKLKTDAEHPKDEL